MPKRRLILFITLLSLILPIVAACGSSAATIAPVATTAPTISAGGSSNPTPIAPSSTDGSSASDKVLRIHQLGYPDLLDPQKISSSEQIVILSQNYEGLTRLNAKLETVPGAAESWEYNADATEITFKLRDNLRYSDGSPLTAENFVYAIARTCDPETAGDYQGILFDIAGCSDLASTAVTDTAALETARNALNVTAIDAQTIKIGLAQPAPYFHTVASLWVTYPAKQALIEQGGQTWWKSADNQIGNGPFRITKLIEDQEITFGVNEHYWAGRPKLDGLRFITIQDPAVAMEAYRADQLDIFNPDPSQISAIKDDPVLGAEYIAYPAATTAGLDFNLTRKPFDDLKVREAFASAIDRQTYCDILRNGDCLPTLTWIPPGVPGYDAREERFAFDPGKAKAALAASSYGSAAALPEVTFTFSSNNPATQPRVEFLATTWRDVLGVDVKLEALDSKTLFDAKNDPKTFPMLSIGSWIGDYPDPQNWISVYWKTGAFGAAQGYGNPEADRLMVIGDTATDPATRIEAYQSAQKIIVGDLPMAMMYNPVNKFVVKPWVKGYVQTPADNEFPGQWASMTIDIIK